MHYDGIPPEVTLEFLKSWVKPRVSEKRYKHIKGVVAVAKEIAQAAQVDIFLAELCGWLHDACKEVKDKQLVHMAREFGLTLDPILEANGHLLHGPVAAEVAKRELSILNKDVYDAVAQHTLGEVPMTRLSQVVFLADCLEASRPEHYTKPIWAALDLDGATNLEAAIVVATDEGLKFLISDKKSIHPKTISVRNHYLPALRQKVGSN
jgi:predicted HD superfamily hydrolase involved in NAD metabolism